jgi:hypothetical protein
MGVAVLVGGGVGVSVMVEVKVGMGVGSGVGEKLHPARKKRMTRRMTVFFTLNPFL